MTKAKQQLLNADSAYSLQSKSFSEAISKIEFNTKERTVDFLDEKLFISLNTKMRLTDSKAKELIDSTENLNKLITEYKLSMRDGMKELEKNGGRKSSINDWCTKPNEYLPNKLRYE